MSIHDDIPIRQLGRTGLAVSMLGLGCAPLGALDGAEGERAAIETVQYAVEHGCTLVDVAPFYGAGRSERYVGAALAGVPRDSFVLSTKVGRLVSADGDVSFDFSRDGVLRSVEDSLQRLGLDHVDVLHIHDPDDHYEQALNEAYPALSELRDQGGRQGCGRRHESVGDGEAVRRERGFQLLPARRQIYAA